jgi:L-arabinokinase
VAGLAFYVSGHGFGHATRQVALIRALRARAPDLEIRVRSGAPGWIFSERDPDLTCSSEAIDPGVLQSSGLDVDAAGTLAAHESFLAEWDAALERESEWLAAGRPSLVVADVPPLACAAAARAEIPAWVVANFTWAWIFEEWAVAEARWQPVVARHRQAYAAAERAFRLPLHHPDDFAGFARVEDAPLLANRSRLSRAAARARLGVDENDPRRLVLISFGGSGDAIALPRPCPIPHEDLICACDAVIGKAGYSTIAEALVHGTRFLYLPRAYFPEAPVLQRGLERLGCARAMPRADFEAGRWRAHLDALFASPEPGPGPSADGAERIADALLERIGDPAARPRVDPDRLG